jgi:hypothetical protein
MKGKLDATASPPMQLREASPLLSAGVSVGFSLAGLLGPGSVLIAIALI